MTGPVGRVPPLKRSILPDDAALGIIMPPLLTIAALCVATALVCPVFFKTFRTARGHSAS